MGKIYKEKIINYNGISFFTDGIGKTAKRIFKNKKEQKHLAFGLLTSW